MLSVFRRTFYLSRLYIRPSLQSHLVIKEQIAFRLTLADHQQWRIHRQLTEVEVAQDIHIMNKDRTLGVEQGQCFLDTSTRL